MRFERSFLAVLASGILIAGCLDSPPPTKRPDGGGDTGGSVGSDSGPDMGAAERDGSGAADTPSDLPRDGTGPAMCDPVAQSCAAPNPMCAPVCPASTPYFGCVTGMPGTGMPGQNCLAIAPCEKGSICFDVSTAYKCRKYCNGDGDCAGKTCEMVNIGVSCQGSMSVGQVMAKLCSI